MRELHRWIDNFETYMEAQLCEVWVPNLSNLRVEVATLRTEVHLLAEVYIPVVPLVIPSFTQSLPRLPPMVFDLFVEDDEAPPVGAKRRSEEEELGKSEEF